MKLSRVIFWDTNPDKIDYDKHSQYVIERVLVYGTIEDWNAIKKKYGIEKIKKTAIQARDLDPKTLSFCSHIFDVPKEDFRCYIIKQSMPGHWEY